MCLYHTFASTHPTDSKPRIIDVNCVAALSTGKSFSKSMRSSLGGGGAVGAVDCATAVGAVGVVAAVGVLGAVGCAGPTSLDCPGAPPDVEMPTAFAALSLDASETSPVSEAGSQPCLAVRP